MQLNSNPCILSMHPLLYSFWQNFFLNSVCPVIAPVTLHFRVVDPLMIGFVTLGNEWNIIFQNFCQMSEIWQLHHHICWEEIRIVKWRNLWKVEKSKTAFEIFFENCMMWSVERSLYLFRSCKGHEITICSNLLNCLTC